jgi:hypothetical protein
MAGRVGPGRIGGTVARRVAALGKYNGGLPLYERHGLKRRLLGGEFTSEAELKSELGQIPLPVSSSRAARRSPEKLQASIVATMSLQPAVTNRICRVTTRAKDGVGGGGGGGVGSACGLAEMYIVRTGRTKEAMEIAVEAKRTCRTHNKMRKTLRVDRARGASKLEYDAAPKWTS